MKKIFTLMLVAAGTISIASAQTGKHQSIAYNDSKKFEHYDAFGKPKGVGTNNFFFSKPKKDKMSASKGKHDNKVAFEKSNRHFGKNKESWLKKKEFSKMKMQHAKRKMHMHKW